MSVENGGRRVPTFFYGSFMLADIRRTHGIDIAAPRVARLWGYDVRVDPLTRLIRADGACVYGVVGDVTHAQLATLYSAQWMDSYLPEPVIAELLDGGLAPALCYLPDGPSQAPPPPAYLDSLVAGARALGLPEWYVVRLEAERG